MISIFRKSKEIIWYGAIIAVLAFIIVSLISFAKTGEANAKIKTEEYLKETVGKTADSFGESYRNSEVATDLLCGVLANGRLIGNYDKINYAAVLKDQCEGALATAIVDEAGIGFDNNGKLIDVSEADFYAELAGDLAFYYSVNTVFTDNEANIVLAKPYTSQKGNKGYVIVVFDAAAFNGDNISNGFDKGSFFAVVNERGECVTSFGTKNLTILSQKGVWDNFSSITGNPELITEVRNKSATQTQLLHVHGKNETRVYIIAPMKMGEWRLIVSLGSQYFDTLQQREWQKTRLLCLEIGIACVAFFGLILAYNIVKSIKDRASQEELEVKADTDVLTGLYNKAATEKLIKSYIAQNPETQGMFIILDLDNFKTINDTMGHTFGDEVLHYLGMRLSSQFRVTDIVGRVGGDEFMIFLKNMRTKEDIEAEARKMGRFFNNFQVGEYTKYYATASMGAAIYPEDAATFEDLYKAADTALYRAKKRGKKHLAFYNDRYSAE